MCVSVSTYRTSYRNICMYLFCIYIHIVKHFVKHFVEGVDFEHQDYYFSFDDGDQEFQLFIRPIDDNIVESDETYNLTIILDNEYQYRRVILGNNHTATVTIYDDDGKCVAM